MARAAAKGGKRARQDARRKQQQQRPAPSTGRRRLSTTEETLFFSRIRRQAKWAYVILAVLFAVTFAALGVGSGQGGLDQLFNQVFHGGGSGSSVSKLEKQTSEHPKDAAAWKQLAIAYAGKQRNRDAVTAMQQYTKLRPKDAGGWSQLGQFQSTAAASDANLYNVAQAQANAWQLAAYQPLTPTGKLGTAAGTNPVVQGAQSQASQAQSFASSLHSTATSEYVSALRSLGEAAALEPKDPSSWNNILLQSIGAMRTIGTDPRLAGPALRAYAHLKKLDPTTAAQYKQLIPTIKQVVAGPGR